MAISGTLPTMVRIVIGVDPSGTSGPPTEKEKKKRIEKTKSNDVGIVAAGLGVDGKGYVLGDWTCNLSPEGWGRRVAECYEHFSGDRIVAEQNFGGAMVEFVIRTVDPNLPVKMVHASRGKVARAEPVSALFEQRKILIAAHMPELEDELVCFTSVGYVGGSSPNRADAMVWALTDLMIPRKQFPGMGQESGLPL